MHKRPASCRWKEVGNESSRGSSVDHGADAQPALLDRDQGGLSYPVADHANAFITPAYPETLILAIPGKGIVYLGLGSIDAIHNEHEAVSAHG